LAFAQTAETPAAPPKEAPAPPAKATVVGEITAKTIPAMTAACVMEKAADHVPEGGYAEGEKGMMQAYESMMNKGFEKLGAWMKAGGVPMGPCFAFYYEDPMKTAPKDLTCKLGFPTAADAKAEAPVVIEQIPEMLCVVAQYKGPYESSAEPWNAADKWATDNGYVGAGAPMEVYLVGPGEKVTPDQYLTEIRIPVKKAEAAPAEGQKK